MEHMYFITDMFEWGLQHISTIKYMILLDALVGATQNSQKTQAINRQMLHFLGISGTFTGHSISLGVHNGTLDGGLYAQLMMKKHLTDINILHMSFKKKSVINFNHIAKSLKKQ